MYQEKKKIDKRIRKLQLRSELCAIEAEEVQELDVDFSKQFSQDFELEILFLEHKRNEQAKLADQRRIRPKAPKEGPAQTVEKKTDVETNEGLKKLHKQLAFELHPDRSKKEDHKEFLELQSAWERKEYERMLGISFKLDIDLQEILDADSVSMMERSLLDRERKIQATKRNARWVWCQSNKSDKTRLLVRRALGVREQEFEAWLATQPKKSNTEDAIEHDEGRNKRTNGTPRKALA
jgi:hypothetical protein